LPVDLEHRLPFQFVSFHILTVIACACVLGCGRPPAGTTLKFVDIGVDEDSHPVSLAVIVENTSRAATRLTSARANVGWNYLITGKVPTEQLHVQSGLEYGYRVVTHVSHHSHDTDA